MIMTSRAQGGCRILTNVHNGSSSLSPLPLQTDFCQWFIATTYSPFASWSLRYGERKILSWRTALIPRLWWFDTSPPVSWYPVLLSVLTELSLPCLPGLPSVCIFSVLRRKFNICETLAWSLGAIYVTGTEMLHNLLYFGDDTFPMWSKRWQIQLLHMLCLFKEGYILSD